MKIIKTFKMFEKSIINMFEKSIIIIYHGTDILIQDANEFSLPLWITPDHFLAMHFCLNPGSSSRKVERGYIYNLRFPIPGLLKRIREDSY